MDDIRSILELIAGRNNPLGLSDRSSAVRDRLDADIGGEAQSVGYNKFLPINAIINMLSAIVREESASGGGNVMSAEKSRIEGGGGISPEQFQEIATLYRVLQRRKLEEILGIGKEPYGTKEPDQFSITPAIITGDYDFSVSEPPGGEGRPNPMVPRNG